MSIRSQQANMRRLAVLLGQDLGYISGERESGPNGAKRTFLNVGRTFLRALAKDLGLREVQVSSNAGGIAAPGDCCLSGMWQNGGIYICLMQPCCGKENVVLYRTIRTIHDHKGGYNHYLRRQDLENLSYERLLEIFSTLRKDGCWYERAA